MGCWVVGCGCSGPGVELGVDGFEPRLVDAGVDLCGVHILVSEEFLYDSEVCASGEEVCGEGVSEDMGVDVSESCGFGASADDLPDGDAFEWSAGA